jgi:hypothetical protein
LTALGHRGPEAERCLACGARVSGDSCVGCRRQFRSERLRFTSGLASGSVFRVAVGTYEAGRRQICPTDTYMSRRQLHVTAPADAGFVQVADAGAPNPTLLDGLRPSSPLLLLPGSRLSVARAEAVLEA